MNDESVVVSSLLNMKISSAKIAALTYAAVLALVLVWVGGAVFVPVVLNGSHDSESSLVASLLHYAYGRICHQMPDRSFHIAGEPLAVCARCLGIYAGYIVGLILYPLARSLSRADAPPRSWLIPAIAPVAIDFAGGYIGLFENTLASRSITGLIAGAAGAFYTLPGLISLTAKRPSNSGAAATLRSEPIA